MSIKDKIAKMRGGGHNVPHGLGEILEDIEKRLEALEPKKKEEPKPEVEHPASGGVLGGKPGTIEPARLGPNPSQANPHGSATGVLPHSSADPRAYPAPADPGNPNPGNPGNNPQPNPGNPGNPNPANPQPGNPYPTQPTPVPGTPASAQQYNSQPNPLDGTNLKS